MTIKELRAQKKLTQSAFAKSIGVGLSTIAGYEAGRIQPSEAVAARIKEMYGAEIAVAPKAAKKTKAAKPAAEKKAAKPAAKPAAEKKAAKPAAEKKAAKPAAEKKAKAVEAKPAAVRKAPPRKTRAAKKSAEPVFIIQSPLGGEITPFAILAKVGEVDKVYIRVDLNKAFWVKGNETGSVDLW